MCFMKNRRINVLAVFSLVLSVSCLTSYRISSAQVTQNEDKGIDSLVDYAIRLYLSDQMDEAVVEFKKALLIDPSNISSKYYLNKISKENSRYSNISTQVDMADNLKQLSDLNLIVDKETEVYQGMIRTLEEQIKDQKAAKADPVKDQEYDKLQEGIEERDNKILFLETKLKKLNNTLSIKDNELAQTNNDGADSAKMKNLEMQLADKNNRISELMKEISGYEKMNLDAINALKDRKGAQESLQLKEKELQEKISELKSAIEDKEDNKNQLMDQIAQQEKDIKEVQFNKEIETQGLTEIIAAKDKEIVQYQQKIYGITQDAQNNNDARMVLEKKVELLEKRLNEKINQATEGSAVTEEKDKKIEALENNLLNLQDQIKINDKKLKQEIQDISNTNLRNLEKFNDLDKVNKSLVIQNADLIEKNKILTDNQSKAENSVKELTQKLEKTSAQRAEENVQKDQSIKELEKNLKSANEEVMKTKTQSQEQIKLLEGSLANSKNSEKDFGALVKNKQSEIEGLKKANEELKTDNSNYQKQVSQFVNDHEKQMKELTGSLGESKGALKAKEDELTSLNSKLKVTQDNLAISEAKLIETSRKLEEQLQAVVDTGNLQKDSIFKDKKIEQMGRFIEEYKSIIAAKDQEINNMGKALNSANKKMSSDRKEMEKMKQDSKNLVSEKEAGYNDYLKVLKQVKDLNNQKISLEEKLNVQEKLMAQAEKLSPSAHAAHINDLINQLGNAKSELKLTKGRLEQAELERKGNNIKKDTVTRKPVLSSSKGKQINEKPPGGFSISHYEFVSRKLGSYMTEQKIRVLNKKSSLNIIISGDILFDSGSQELNARSFNVLNTVAEILGDNYGSYNVDIVGHTDSQPIRQSKWESNFELSVARALSVYHYFINTNNLDTSRFSVTGKGEIEPIADNSSADGRRQNRRIEVNILFDESKASNPPDDESELLKRLQAINE